MTGADPLIVTALLDPVATAWFGEQRQRHFPPDRLVVGAHVTLFHHLPGDDTDGVAAELAAGARDQAPMPATVSDPRSLGGGVAYDLVCPPLLALRQRLAERWHDRLTAQDRAWHRPHVTVQNKVPPAVARQTLTELLTTSRPQTAQVEGLGLWRYVGGPWEAVASFPFARVG